MDHKSKLIEQYEDALFALMMDEVAEQEGNKLLQELERLENDADFAVPEASLERCRKFIASYDKRGCGRAAGRGAGRALKRVLIAALLGMLLFATAMAASEDLRLKVLNFTMEVFSNRTDFRFTSDGAEMDDSDISIAVNWVPDGYQLVESNLLFSGATFIYQNEDGDSLEIFFHSGEAQSVSLNTEDADTSDDIEVAGMSGKLVYRPNENCRMLFLINTDEVFTISITGYGLTERELIRIAENINF